MMICGYFIWTCIVYFFVASHVFASSKGESESVMLANLRKMVSTEKDQLSLNPGPDVSSPDMNARFSNYPQLSGPPKDAVSDRDISPIALYLIRRLMSGPPKSVMPPKRSRDQREDHVMNVYSRDGRFPWDEDCARGYTHCGGYFPLCCDGFLCLKPLTDWDKRHGYKRCWPDYFKTDE